MLARRPLLYLTIPSLALLIGLWFRRKKAIAAKCDSGGGKKSGQASEGRLTGSAVNSGGGNSPETRARRDISDSVPIDGGDASSLLNNTSGGAGGTSSGSNSSSKSAPITIGPNSRSPPIPIANKPGGIGGGGHTSDELNSVGDESSVGSSVSPVDLPGSYERRNFEFVKNSHLYNKRVKGSMDVPVKVITACKSPKISPKNAFNEAPKTTSTPAAANKQKESQQSQKHKSPKMNHGNSNNNTSTVQMNASLRWGDAEEEQVANGGGGTGDESLSAGIQSQMAKLSLSDNNSVNSKKHNNSVETNPAATAIDSKGNHKGVENKQQQQKNNNNKKADSTQVNGEEEKQQQPPTISSPPLSLYSVHSNDSGKGSSPTQSEAATVSGNCYEFLVHEQYVGVLIGRSGIMVKKLRNRCQVAMIVRRVANTPRPTDRVCAIMGEPENIAMALNLIRQRMPLDKCPDLSLERVYYSSSPLPNGGGGGSLSEKSRKNDSDFFGVGGKHQPVMPIHYPVAQLPLSLSLVEGINNDVVISAILNGGHVFLQQPSHPTFQQLQALHALMAQSYATGESPALEIPPQVDSICVAPVGGQWFRVVIVSYSAVAVEGEQPTCLVKFLDFGGFVTVPAADLRQIRTDFMTLPFQSTECVLSNVRPIGGEWTQAAADLVFQLSNGRVLQAQVAGYTVDGLPEVFLYATLGPNSIAFINQELVAQGFAEWMEDDEEAVDQQQVKEIVEQQEQPVLAQ